MRRCARLMTLLTVLAVWPLETANSQPVDDNSCGEARDLLDFILSETEYTGLAFCPSFRVADDDALLSSVHFSNARHQNQPMAVYLPRKNKILISEEVDWESPVGQSFIVHELVHALQFQAGAVGQIPCLGALEAEAYGVQSAYLELEGETDLAWMFRYYELTMGSCVHAYHPDF